MLMGHGHAPDEEPDDFDDLDEDDDTGRDDSAEDDGEG